MTKIVKKKGPMALISKIVIWITMRKETMKLVRFP